MSNQAEKSSKRKNFLIQQLRDQLALGRTLEEAKFNLLVVFEENEVDEAIQEFTATDTRFHSTKEVFTLHDEPNYAGWYGGPNVAPTSVWTGLKRSLADSGWSESMVDNLNLASTGVVEQLAPPQSQKKIIIKGLVLGYVQSGKTANYSAVIAKAVDAGYRLVIVLGGMHNNLRQQTQSRLKTELVDPNPAKCTTLTTVDEKGDFQKKQNVTASRALSVDGFTLVVLKKNSPVLRNFYEWLSSASDDLLSKTPAIIIDDESDQASINTNKEENDPTAINGHIRRLLSRFTVCSFVGYTATPFANVLVNAQENADVFPRDFLISLGKPPNYFGAEELFGRERVGGLDAKDGIPVVRLIPPSDLEILAGLGEKKRADKSGTVLLVPSIKAAIDSFIVACAARYVRGHHKKHMTMLLHVSRLTDIQSTVKAEIDEHLKDLKFKFQDQDQALRERLSSLWQKDFCVAGKDFGTTEYPDFGKIWKYAQQVTEHLDTVLENSKSLERLSYDSVTPIRSIVIGGNTLSRGLTLQGLTVSYFLRTTKAYDTLLQMGRWFGYRPGYIDLTRIYVTEPLRNHFYHLATVEQEIRDEIRMMAANEERPIDVGLRIRNHPHLTVTAPNKMRRAEDCAFTFSGTKIQARHIITDQKEVVDSNYRAVKNLHARCAKYGKKVASKFQDFSNALLYRSLSQESILQFLDEYFFSSENGKFTSELLKDYILKQSAASELTDWSIAFLSSRNGAPVDLGGTSINVFDRSILRRVYDQSSSASVQLRALSTPGDEIIDLGECFDHNVSKTEDVLPRGRERESEIALRRKYRPRERGLLIIHPLNWNQPKSQSNAFSLTEPLSAKGPVFGITFVFPFAASDQSKYGFVRNVSVTGPSYNPLPIPTEELAKPPQSLKDLVARTGGEPVQHGSEIRLSKSQYVKGRKCLKRLWLYNFKKELADTPSETQQLLFAQGNEVGQLARTYFKMGHLINEDYRNSEAALDHTERTLNDSNISAIFEGAFVYDNVLIRVDILRKHADGSYDLIEVKSTNSVKKEHLDDIAIQKFVLENAGLNIKQSFLMHLNPDYVRNGEIDLNSLFVLEPMDDEIEELVLEVPNYLKLIRSKLAETREPEGKIGSVCKNPYVCEFRSYCWKDVGDDSIHKLTRISDKNREELLELGIKRVADIPDGFALSDLQAVQTQAAKLGKAIIDSDKIVSHLKELQWPLHFLDYETISFAIPRYPATSPYQQLPFQFSLHIQDKPDGELRHFEFLHRSDSDPRLAFVENLLNSIDGDKGSIVVYHSSFERGITLSLSQLLPDLKDAFEEISSRLWDLETPFAKYWYCDPLFTGSSSIKNVLPVMVPDLSYKTLEIQKGDVAQQKYGEMIACNDPEQKEQLAKALLAYCALDTLAMVKILQRLRSAIKVD